jgi:hypothetical protein
VHYVPGSVRFIALELNTATEYTMKQVVAAQEASTDSDYDPSWFECVDTLLNSARGNTKERNAKGREIEAVALTFQDIVQIFRDQRGRCAYSDIAFTKDGPWKISLERIDNTHGYTRENVLLICKAFNAADRSHTIVGGCSGLTRDKLQALIASYREHKDWVEATITAIRFMKE